MVITTLIRSAGGPVRQQSNKSYWHKLHRPGTRCPTTESCPFPTLTQPRLPIRIFPALFKPYKIWFQFIVVRGLAHDIKQRNLNQTFTLPLPSTSVTLHDHLSLRSLVCRKLRPQFERFLEHFQHATYAGPGE